MYPGISGNTQGDKKLTIPAPKAKKISNIYPVFLIAADIPAILVINASLSFIFAFFLSFFFDNLFITTA